MTKTGLRIAIWATAAVAAAAAATGAVALSTSGRGQVLSQDDVARQLASSDPSTEPPDVGTPTPSVPATPDPAASLNAKLNILGKTKAGYRILSAIGGTIVAHCDGELVTLLSWSPNPGYRADHVVRGPAAVASIEFESDTAADISVTVTCLNGMPVSKQAIAVDDGGRGGGGKS